MKTTVVAFTLPMSAILTGVSPVFAQVIPDHTLGTTVSPGPDQTITGGTRPNSPDGSPGSNLFHSFEQFSILPGGSATFANDLDIQNIFARVTGTAISQIEGRLATQGRANLFLMNPNGIMFGAGASLNIGGSFIASTANSIRFPGDLNFDTAIATPALLTVSAPIGLQMGNNPGGITSTGATLQVADGNTLALIGGGISQTGGLLQILGGNGRIELASLGDDILYSAKNWAFLND